MALEEPRGRVLGCALEAYGQGLMTMTSGNFSGRDPLSGLVAITPSGRSYAGLQAEDVVVVDRAGALVEARCPAAPP